MSALICFRCGNDAGTGHDVTDRDLDCEPCLMFNMGHAAGKREGIEAAAKDCDDKGCPDCAEDIRALLQTEARAETGEGKR
jgi:hypothetical protein